MKLKKVIFYSVLSLAVFFILVPLGGYGGHHIKFLVAVLLYFSLTWYFLHRVQSKKEKIWIVIILSLPPMTIYLPMHAMYEGSQIAYISTAGHFIGIIAGVIVSNTKKAFNIGFIAVLILVTFWVTFIGYSLYLNKLNFGTFTGKVRDSLPEFQLLNHTGDTITNQDLNEKLVIMDFWTTSCRICFKKFPVLENLADQYKDRKDVEFYAVNVPISRDTLWQGREVMKNLKYNFSNLFAIDKKIAEQLNVYYYPTVLLIKNGDSIIYRGNIEGIDAEISSHLVN